MSKLVVINEEFGGRTFELSEERMTVGRLPDNIIQIEDPAISSHHAEMTRRGEDYVVRDLNSTNGTRVNGQRVVETRLYHGDTVAFGHIQLQYFSSAKGAPQPLPQSKKTVDLSGITPGTTNRPSGFHPSSPYGGSKSKGGASRKILQIAVVGLGFVAVVVLAYAVYQLIG